MVSQKTLTVGLSKSGGRNNTGRVTSWHRGGGIKENIELLILKELNMICLLLWKELNMIQIDHLS